jgi:hypothetical protein
VGLGTIYDPRNTTGAIGTPYRRFLGRQVVFSVNAVNQIATSRVSVTTTAAKTSIATITVIYADPYFEGSAGAIFSFVHNRTFTNQTLANVPTGSTYMAGDVVLQETKTRPVVVPFVAGNWRLGNDFDYPFNHRRGAFYATVYVGLNPDTTLPEYGVGPSLSWRSVMLSAFYERAHDTRLIAGETVGSVLCGPTTAAPTGTCTTTPAAPTSQPYATNGFGIGISIRVPTTFTAGTGGVSH